MQMIHSGDNDKTYLLSQIDQFFFQCMFDNAFLISVLKKLCSDTVYLTVYFIQQQTFNATITVFDYYT